ncbi:MAG: hypothetical protein IH973_13940 [Myxococcales bacterium]|nr:hypothetical protein [Myxococcales bacterium]
MRVLGAHTQLGVWPWLVPLLLYGIHTGAIFNWYVDDAFISQVYARTLVETGVFAYSAGDVPHYGISNPLWVGVLAIAHLLGLHPYLFEKALCIAFGGAALAAVVLHTWKLFPENSTRGRAIAMLPGLALAASWNYCAWAVGGLETLCFAALVAFGSLDLARRLAEGRRDLWKSALLLAPLGLLRPEGLGIVGLSGLATVGAVALRYPRGERLVSIAAFALPPIAVMLAGLGIIYSLTDALVPSTYYLKAGHLSGDTASRGLAYAETFLRQTGALLPGLALLGILLGTLRARRFDSLRFTTATVAGVVCLGYAVGFIVPVGGDWMLGSRFFVHLYPLLAVLAALAVGQLICASTALPRKLGLFSALALPLALGVLEIRPSHSGRNDDTGSFLPKIWFEMPQDRPSYPAGSWALVEELAAGCAEDRLLAMTEGGFFAWYTGCRVFDLHGWSRRSLAMERHRTQRWDSPGFLRQILDFGPDYVLLSGYARGDELTYRLTIERALAKDPEFEDKMIVVILPDAGERYLSTQPYFEG